MQNNDKTAEELAKATLDAVLESFEGLGMDEWIASANETYRSAMQIAFAEARAKIQLALAITATTARAEGYREGLEGKWLPIEGAPQELDILLLTNDGVRRIGKQFARGMFKSELDFGDSGAHQYYPSDYQPVSWQPLPPAPKGEE